MGKGLTEGGIVASGDRISRGGDMDPSSEMRDPQTILPIIHDC